MPKRIQRKRVKGWRMPPNTVSIARPGKWGNPFKIGITVDPESGKLLSITRENCLFLFEAMVIEKLAEKPGLLEPLRGKDVACFCSLDEPCHGDVLLRYANRD